MSHIKVRALVLLSSEPLQDPARALINQTSLHFLYELKIVSYLGIIFGSI